MFRSEQCGLYNQIVKYYQKAGKLASWAAASYKK
jgi:hypothetical protein